MPRRRVGHFKSQRAHKQFLNVYQAAMAELPTSEATDVPTSFGTVRAYRFDGPSSGPPVVLLPGRNASTPMWRVNIPVLQKHRTVIGIDLLGEAGMSVQHKPITEADDEAQWLDETLSRLRVDRPHLMGVSIGGWTAANYAVRRPGRASSLILLDPVLTFARIPVKALLVSAAMFLPFPEPLQRKVFSWIGGGADVDYSVPEAALISAGSNDYVLRKAMPKLLTDDQLRSLDIPVLALIAGRSVMLDAGRAAAQARRLLLRGEVEVWPDASHAINGRIPGTDRPARGDVLGPCRRAGPRLRWTAGSSDLVGDQKGQFTPWIVPMSGIVGIGSRLDGLRLRNAAQTVAARSEGP